MKVLLIKVLQLSLLMISLGFAKPNIKPQTVIVLYNSKVKESEQLAKYYAKKRSIPTSNLVGIPMPKEDKITRLDYINKIETPLKKVFKARNWWEEKDNGKFIEISKSKISTIVTVFGVPFGTTSSKPTNEAEKTKRLHDASIDSELCLLGINSPARSSGYYKSSVINPYFNKDFNYSQLNQLGYFMVGRIDGPSIEICKRLVDDALEVEQSGLNGFAYLDLAKKGAAFSMGDKWISDIERQTWEMQIPTIIDKNTYTFADNYPMEHAAIYFGWYTANFNGPLVNPDFKFKKGAIAVHLHSFSAQNLRSANTNWTGPILQKGAAATLGNVYEPYLTGTHFFNIFYDRLAKGYTLVEAAHMSISRLGWQAVVIGDPLYQPFKNLNSPIKKNKVDVTHHNIRKAFTNWGDDPKKLSAKMKLATRRSKNTIYLEAIGLKAMYAKDYETAEKHFKEALQLSKKSNETARLSFHLIETFLSSNKSAQANTLIEKLDETLKGKAEHKCIDIYKAIIKERTK